MLDQKTKSEIIIKAMEHRLYAMDQLISRNLKQSRYDQITDEWFNYAISFTTATQLLLKTVISTDDFEHRRCILPIFYNLRHSIELILKYLLRITGEQKDTTHNISTQFEKLKTDLTKKGKNFEAIIRDNGDPKLNADTLKKVQKDYSIELEAIVNKYYFQTPVLKDLKNEHFYIEDTNNELFKYPEAKNIQFGIAANATLNLNKTKLAHMDKDLTTLTKCLHLFYHIFQANYQDLLQ